MTVDTTFVAIGGTIVHLPSVVAVGDARSCGTFGVYLESGTMLTLRVVTDPRWTESPERLEAAEQARHWFVLLWVACRAEGNAEPIVVYEGTVR